MSASKAMRRIAAITSIAVGGAAVAPAAQACGLGDNLAGLNKAGFALSSAVAEGTDKHPDTKEIASRDFAGGFYLKLEAGLKAPTADVQHIKYPEKVSKNILQMHGLVAAKGFGAASETLVCAQKNDRIAGLWTITNQGAVQEYKGWTGSMVNTSESSFACKDFLLAKRSEMRNLQTRFTQIAASGTCLAPESIAATPTVPGPVSSARPATATLMAGANGGMR